MAFRKIGRTDASYNTLKKGYNLRWPSNGNPGADYVYICSTADDILAAANDALKNNCRITVRSGGHCYEGFVSNAQATPNSLPNGIGTTPQGLLPNQKPLAIIDVGLYTGSNYDPQGKLRSPYSTNSTTYKFRAAVGNQNWDNYIALYKSSGKTIPGGSCYSVGLGGHISGGGYGLLSRLHGLTVDWLSGVDILVPSSNGRQLIPKHVNAKSTGDDALLFIACKGGGGGNFGIITNYYFADLPDAPQQAYWLTLSFP